MVNNNLLTKAKMDSLKAFMSTPESIAVADEEFEKTMSSKSQMLEKEMTELLIEESIGELFDFSQSKTLWYFDALPQEDKITLWNLLFYISERAQHLKKSKESGNIKNYDSKLLNLQGEVREDLEDLIPLGFLPKQY